MSILLNKYFANTEDITQSEYYNFFAIDYDKQEQQKLENQYQKLFQQNDGKVDFNIIAESSKNYESLINILCSVEDLKNRIDSYSVIQKDQNAYNTIIELFVTLDIYQYIKKLADITYNSIEKYFELLRNESIKSNVAQKKFKNLHKETKNLCQGFEQAESRINPASNDLQQQISALTDVVTELKKEVKSNNVNKKQHTQENIDDDFIDIKQINVERSELLTKEVWPKSRMLLAIVSKMSKEGFLNKQQKGALKDLIIDNDERIVNLLRQYQFNGDKKLLYQNFLKLTS